MKRGTTYPITLTVKGVDLSEADWVIVSIKPKGMNVFEFDREHMSLSSDGTDTVIVVGLTQEQSVAMATIEVVIDCNWMISGVRGGAIPVSIPVSPTLLTRVVEE